MLDAVRAGGSERLGAEAILAIDWFETTADATPDPLLATELGSGKAAAIAIAYAIGAQLLLDDRKARRIAMGAYKLRVMEAPVCWLPPSGPGWCRRCVPCSTRW